MGTHAMRPVGLGIGIEKIGVYPCALSLSIAELCDARGLDCATFVDRFFCEERSVVGPFEDAVTLAVNAADRMLDDGDRRAIRLLIVGTESAPDLEKPVSSWVHRFLSLDPRCRNFEVKHACYGATAGVQMALSWLASADPGAKALVINTDHAMTHFDSTQEPVLGAGAAAVLLSRTPNVVEYERGWNGVHAHETADIFRPAFAVETGDADESLTSYLDGVEAAYSEYARCVGGAIDFDRFFAAHVYHVPFGGLAQRAHFRLARQELALGRGALEAHWAAKSRASLTYNRRMGGVYGAATFVALAGLIEHSPGLRAGDRIGIYAYGSGSCAEFYSARLAATAREVVGRARIAEQLEGRRRLTMAEYEACERALMASLGARDVAPATDLLDGLYESHYAGQRRLTFTGTQSYFRSYAWS